MMTFVVGFVAVTGKIETEFQRMKPAARQPPPGYVVNSGNKHILSAPKDVLKGDYNIET